MPKLDTFWGRLLHAMRLDGYKGPETQTAIGDHWGVKQTGARKWQEGGLPKLSRVVEMAVDLNVMTEWLLSGRPPMRPMDPLTDDEQTLLRLFRELHDHGRRQQLLGWLEQEVEMQPQRPPGNAESSGIRPAATNLRQKGSSE